MHEHHITLSGGEVVHIKDGIVTHISPPLIVHNQGDLYMSFSFSGNDTPAVLKVQVQGHQMPQSIKDFIIAGIDALVETFGQDDPVAVSASGHLHSPGNYTTTSASINVYKAPQV